MPKSEKNIKMEPKQEKTIFKNTTILIVYRQDSYTYIK